MQENLEVVIQARIEKVLGKETLQNDLAESAKEINKIGSESAGKISGLMQSEQFPNLSKEEMASMEKIGKALDATGKIVDEKAQELLKEYLEEEEIGLTKSQRKSWQRKFKKAGQEAGIEIDELMRFIEGEGAGLPEDKREMYELLKASVKEMSEEVSSSYENMSQAVKDYHEVLKNTSNTQRSFFDQLQKAGYFALGGLAVNQAGQIALTGQRIEARERTAFDFTSPLGAYTEKEQFELFKETAERSMLASTIGMLIGGGIGAFAGGLSTFGAGTAMGAVAGAGFGKHIGGMAAEYFNIEAEGELKERLKFFGQTFQKATQYVEEYRPYDIDATRLGIRFSANLRGSSGYGFTKEQELKYKEVFAESMRQWEEYLYEDQLKFSRATGMDPAEVMRLNRYARITGGDYSLTSLDAAKQYSKQIFGEGADNKRVVDILESIAKINMEMLKVSADAESREAAKFAALPALLFGKENPYGRLGDLGDQTIGILAGLGRPSSEPHEAMLFQAYMRDNQSGMFGNEGVLARMRGGIFYKDNLERIMKEAEITGGGSKDLTEAQLMGMLPGATPELVFKLRDIISSGGVDKFIDDLNKKQSELTGEGKSGADVNKILEEYVAGAKNAVSNFETTQEKISRIHGEIAEKWERAILQTQENMLEMENTWLKSSKIQTEAMGKVSEAFESMYENLTEKFDVFSPSGKSFLDKIGITEEDFLSDEDIGQLRSNGKLPLPAPDYQTSSYEEPLDKSKNTTQAEFLQGFAKEFKKELYDGLKDGESEANIHLHFHGISQETQDELENSIITSHSEE